MVKISVIIPVYNTSQYLRRCMDSVVQQSLKEIEIICVDDGSTDESRQILLEYHKADERVTVISQENAGAGAARNKGMQYATGKYISFLDSDDFFEETMLEKAYELAEQDEADFVVYKSDQYYTKDDEFFFAKEIVDVEHIPPYQPFDYRQLSTNVFKVFVGWTWDKLYLKSFIDENGLTFQHVKSSDDLYFVFSALVLAKRISVCNEILAHQRRDAENSVSKTRENSWWCCYEAMIGLKNTIINAGKYNELRTDYADYALTFILWNIETLEEPSRGLLIDKLKNGWLDELGISEMDAACFMDKNEYIRLNKAMNE